VGSRKNGEEECDGNESEAEEEEEDEEENVRGAESE